MLQLTCAQCREVLRFDDSDAGLVVACSKCGVRMQLLAPPQPAPVPTPVPALGLVPAKFVLAELEDVAAAAAVAKPATQPRKARKLGPVEAKFRVTGTSLLWRTVGWGGGCAVGVLLTIYGIVVATKSHGITVGQVLVALLLFGGLGAATVALCGYFLWQVIRDRDRRVLLSRRGFAIVAGGKRTVYHWEDILAQYQNITEHYNENGCYLHTTHVYTLKCVEGERLVFDDSLANVQKLGEAIAEQLTNRELPRVRAEYDAGELVTFDKLGVSRKGLSYGQSFLTWQEIRGVRIHEGCISVSKKGKWLNWCTITASSVPNLFVFLALVDEIIGLKGA